MIYIISYYNYLSKNGGSNRLESLFRFLKSKENCKFITLSKPHTENEIKDVIHLKYWKNASLLDKLGCLIYKLFYVLGLILTNDPFYCRQVKTSLRKVSADDILVFSFPTINDFILASYFAKKGKKVHIDFRDSILDDSMIKLSYYQRIILKRHFNNLRCSGLVTVSSVSLHMSQQLESYFSNPMYIPNFRDLTLQKSIKFEIKKSLSLVLFGQIESSYSRDSKIFFEAIQFLALKYPQISFHFTWFGLKSNAELNLQKEMLSELKNLTFENKTPIDENQLLKETFDIALLYGVEGMPGYISSKFFSYLALNIPIIAASQGNELGYYIEKYNVGYSGVFDREFIIKALKTLENLVLYDVPLTDFNQKNVLRYWKNALI